MIKCTEIVESDHIKFGVIGYDYDFCGAVYDLRLDGRLKEIHVGQSAGQR